MNCWFCGATLIWGGDFSLEDYGYEGDGLVSNLSCPNCGATVEYTYSVENDTRCTEV